MPTDTPTDADAEIIAAMKWQVQYWQSRGFDGEAQRMRAVLARLEGLAAPGEWLPVDEAALKDAVGRAICKSRTCEGVNCCQWPANRGRTKCPVDAGGYDDTAAAAIGVIREALPAAPATPKGGSDIRSHHTVNVGMG